MSLPSSYTIKTNAIPDYFEAMLNAQPPERFSQKFLEGLGFSSSNDRLFIGILKDLGFLNADGAPTQRYYSFLDRSIAPHIVAEGVREAFSDLFSVNTKAFELNVGDAFNKLRTLYQGEKKDTVIKNIAKTFVALCDYGDFVSAKSDQPQRKVDSPEVEEPSIDDIQVRANESKKPRSGIASLQYHINIVLPDTRDQAVFDAIFKSLRDHLG